MSSASTGRKGKCKNCRKRIYERRHGKYLMLVWHHANGDRECAGLMCKYAYPEEDRHVDQ